LLKKKKKKISPENLRKPNGLHCGTNSQDAQFSVITKSALLLKVRRRKFIIFLI
jgi:hypothetical protein